MSSTGGRSSRRKRGAAADRDASDQVQPPPHKISILHLVGSPLRAVLSLLRLVAVYCGIVLAWLYERLTLRRRGMAARSRQRLADGQGDSIKGGEEEYNNDGDRIKNYHKQAFEYISLALRIDEDEKGV